MEQLNYEFVIWVLILGSGLSFGFVRLFRSGFYFNMIWIAMGLIWAWSESTNIKQFVLIVLIIGLPLLFINVLWYVFFPKEGDENKNNRYKVRLQVSKGKLLLENRILAVSYMIIRTLKLRKWHTRYLVKAMFPSKSFLLTRFMLRSTPSHQDTCPMLPCFSGELIGTERQ